jgi:pimeloyl-ACP methyl ester carboxylesterase
MCIPPTQGRDFDTLARALQGDYRVVCPDVVGRGESDWLVDPGGYQISAYVADMVTLLARLDAATVHWVGTSMGGLIGMALASLSGSPLRKLVLNDAGPVVSHASLERIGAYVGLTPVFPTFEMAEKYVRTISAPFGPHSDEQWRFLAESWVRKGEDGAWRPHYDPRIAEPFKANMPEGDLELWQVYDAVRCPTLVLRGAQSDFLSAQTADEMARRNPHIRCQTVAAASHYVHDDNLAGFEVALHAFLSRAALASWASSGRR